MRFHYFALRKMHFLLRARAQAVFPGGFGTMDERFETLTLIQTQKMKPIPILLFGREFWDKVVNFEALAEEGVIGPADLELFHWCETAEDAWEHVARFYKIADPTDQGFDYSVCDPRRKPGSRDTGAVPAVLGSCI